MTLAITGALTAAEDAAGAETTLRETWGGQLCVTTVEKTDADLNTINTELQEALGETLLTSGSFQPDTLDAQVVFDDGSVQEWADTTYGEGLVRVDATDTLARLASRSMTERVTAGILSADDAELLSASFRDRPDARTGFVVEGPGCEPLYVAPWVNRYSLPEGQS